MHGLIFAGLRDYSVEALGTERADELWADRVFSVTEAYEDEWFTAQLDRIATATGRSRSSVDREFGVFAAQTTFAGLYPEYYAKSADVFDFLLGIEEKIHELVRATIRGASPPRLHVQPLGEGVLISYTSHRHLCSLLEGLVHGAAAELGPEIETEEVQCMLRGDTGCVFTVLASARG